jgi:hypothetical protein
MNAGSRSRRFLGVGGGVACLVLVIAIAYLQTRAPGDRHAIGDSQVPESATASRDGAAATAALADGPGEEDSVATGPGKPEVPLPPWPFAAARPALRALAFNGSPPQDLKQEFTVEQDFANESKDLSWSARTEGRIFAEVSQVAGLRLQSIDVDCRTTLCRVQLTFPIGTQIDETPLAAGSPPQFSVAEPLGLETQFMIAAPDLSGTPVLLAYLRGP